MIKILSSDQGIRAPLYQTSASMLLQLCGDASEPVLIENNGVVLE